MKIRIGPRTREAVVGAGFGMLASVVIGSLGVWNVAGIRGEVGPGLALAVCGAIVGYVGASGWVILADGLLIAAWLVVGSTGLIGHFTESWVRHDPLPATVDAIVVLSSSATSDSTLDPTATDRLLTALELMKAGLARHIVTTRVVEEIHRRRVSTDADQRRLIRFAGADSSWTLIDSVFSTRDEATRSALVLLPQRVTRIAVVTSPLHTRRACATFEGVGFKVTCVPSRESENATWHPVEFTDRLAAFSAYIYERLGAVKYRAKGWLPQ